MTTAGLRLSGCPFLGCTRMDCRVAIHPGLNGSVGIANESVAATSPGYYSNAISRMRGHRYVSKGCPARPQIHLRLPPPTWLCSPPTSENRDPLPWDFYCIIHEAQCETAEGDIVLPLCPPPNTVDSEARVLARTRAIRVGLEMTFRHLNLHPPEKAVVLCCASMRRARSKHLIARKCCSPMRPGQVECRSHNYVRHGTTTLFAAQSLAGRGDRGPPNAAEPDIRRLLASSGHQAA
jgi:hypothetical protein